jgi:transcriptional regulator with XRE-family HTH domain
MKLAVAILDHSTGQPIQATLFDEVTVEHFLEAQTELAWLKQMANLENAHTVSVGGWVTDLAQAGFPDRSSRPRRSAFTRLLKLARRERNLTMEAFAQEAEINLAELVNIEHDEEYLPSRDTVSRIAQFLALPEGKLLALAGLAVVPDAGLSAAAARFAARSEPVQRLTREEHAALEEFVGFLSKA